MRFLTIAVGCFLAVAGSTGCSGSDTGPDSVPAHVAIEVGSAPVPNATVTSGASLTFTAAVTSGGGEALSDLPVAWASSDQTVVTITSSGVVTGVRAGQASITATVGNIASPAVTVTVTPGAAAQLFVRIQPAGGASGVALATQPVVDVEDAAGNLVTSSPVTVTATIATGGGTITGSTATSAGGEATYASLTISGTSGDRTLTFSASGLSSVTSAGLSLVPGLPAQLVIRTQPLGAVSSLPLVAQPVIEIRDAAGNLVTNFAGTVTAAIGNGVATLTNASVAASKGVATFTQLTVSGPAGDLTLAFRAAGIPAISSASFTLAQASSP